MKTLFNLLLLTLILGMFNSCQSEFEDNLLIVKIKPFMSILDEGTDKPMKVRSDQSSDTSTPIYAIQIYENDSAYYYGLFDDISKMEIALSTSKTYRFKIAAIKNGTGTGLKKEINDDSTSYFLPEKVLLENKFIKGNLLVGIDLPCNIILNNESKDYPEIDVFYATKTITIEKGTTNIDLLLLRMGFGLIVNIQTIPSGRVELYLGNDTIHFNNQLKSIYTVRQFNTSNKSFDQIYNGAETFSDSIPILFNWITDLGTIVSKDAKYEFKRNYQKTLNLELNNDIITFEFENWKSDFSTVTDIDGNVYKTVKIGNQIWMAENLKVTRYRDGSVIPNVTNSSTWANLTSGAWCDYDNNIVNGNNYGHLYNWYAASDNRKIAPEGWHVPTSNEWIILENYLIANGFNYDGTMSGNKISKSLCSNQGWIFSSTIGAAGNTDFAAFQNKTGFNAIAGGHRKEYTTADFVEIGNTASFWSLTPSTSSTSLIIVIRYDTYSTERFEYWNKAGFYIRCVKD
jgi:uncharacterized protein (TIGR02145 family)